jgi:hypothetical protein
MRYSNVTSPFHRIVFTTSLATLLTAAVHHPETLRGLSRWTLGYILQGPNALRLRKKNVDLSEVTRIEPHNNLTSSKKAEITQQDDAVMRY